MPLARYFLHVGAAPFALLIIADAFLPNLPAAQNAQCSSYYISEINVVSVEDTEGGSVQTYVGFGHSKEEAENKALGACSHFRNDAQICLASDRASGRNALDDSAGNSLHLKYMTAVRRITGCK
jgi:hypothetical protein